MNRPGRQPLPNSHRQQRVSPPGRPARPRGRRRRRPAISREQGRASLRLASLRALLRGHIREHADVLRRPKLPRFSPISRPASSVARSAARHCRRTCFPAKQAHALVPCIALNSGLPRYGWSDALPRPNGGLDRRPRTWSRRSRSAVVASRTRSPTESGDRLLPLGGVKPVDERARRQDLDIPDVRLKEIAIPRHERSRGR